MRVQLTWAEMLHGAQVGVMRQLKAISNGSKPGYGLKGLGWNETILGALGELAFSKAMNLYWDNMFGDRPNRKPDVGGYEIKTVSDPSHRLVVRDNTPDDVRVALVVCEGDVFTVAGWITGGKAKQLAQRESYQGREPQYYLEQKHLNPFDGAVKP